MSVCLYGFLFVTLFSALNKMTIHELKTIMQIHKYFVYIFFCHKLTLFLIILIYHSIHILLGNCSSCVSYHQSNTYLKYKLKYTLLRPEEKKDNKYVFFQDYFSFVKVRLNKLNPSLKQM